MRWFWKNRRSRIDVESLIQIYYMHSSVDTTGTNFQSMAERAMRSDGDGTVNLAMTNHTKNKIRSKWYIRLLYPVAALILVVSCMKTSFYLAPTWEQIAYAAIRPVPLFEHLIGPNDSGLLRMATEGKIQSMDIPASSSRITVHVIGSYADTLRTVLFLRVDSPDKDTSAEGEGSWIPDLMSLTLTDQFGHRYHLSSSTWNIDHHQGTIEFQGIPSWRSSLGVRLYLHFSRFQWATQSSAGKKFVQGSWNAQLVQRVGGEPLTIQVGTAQTSNGVTLRLNTVELSPSAARFTVSLIRAGTTSLESSMQNTLPSQTGRITKPSPHDEFYVEDESKGQRIQMFSGETTSYGEVLTQQIITAALSSPGSYRLVIKRFNRSNGDWEFPFTIP